MVEPEPTRYERALRGDFVSLEDTPPASSRSEPAQEAAQLALSSLYRLVAPERVTALEAPALSRLASSEAASVHVARAASHAALEALLNADAARFTVLADALRPAAASAAMVFARSMVTGLGALLSGDAAAATAAADHAYAAARAERWSPFLIEATVLRALSALDTSDTDGATTCARRAARMARTEHLFVHEYLANLALARVRRITGRAYLAARIASALLSVAPRPWRRWLAWELSLAGQRVPNAEGGADVEALTASLDAAERGDHPRFAMCAEACLRASSGFAAMAREARALLALTDPCGNITPTEPAYPFAAGAEADPPYGVTDRNVGATTAALVLVRPGQPPRRLLRTGLHLLRGTAWIVPAESQQDVRTLTLLSAVGLAGDAGLRDNEAFHAVYGFDLVPVKHDTVFRTLRHRARKTLGNSATLAREGGRLHLVPRTAIALPDPRTQLPIGQRILALLAAGHGRVTARQIAEELSIAVRSVQVALGELVDDGVCVAERIGRRVEYGVEDTTFYEPSLHRLAARPTG